MKTKSLVLIVLGFAYGAAFAATTDAPDFEMSFDGLYRRPSNMFDQLWVREQFDVHEYHKVMLMRPFIEYRPHARSQKDPSVPESFLPSKRQQEVLQQTVDTAFREELAKSKYFKLVDKAGPDVLTVKSGLVDVRSYVTPSASPTEAVTVPVAGEALLVIQLYDSESNAIMVRVTDRVVAKRGTDTETADQVVRATATTWAGIFRERLDAASSIPVVAPQ